jgi:hypothetical protein
MTTRVGIQVSGLSEVQQQLQEAVDHHAVATATALEHSLRALTPVRTGRARSGWHTNTSPNQITIENRVPYVPYLDQGTRRMRAANAGRGIIGPALQQSKGKFK